MKKLLFVIFSVVFLFSCSESARDINVEKIDNACDFVDAVGIVAGEMIDLIEEYPEGTDEEDIPESAIKEMVFLEKKMNELENALKNSDWEDEVVDCPNFNKVDKKMTDLGY